MAKKFIISVTTRPSSAFYLLLISVHVIAFSSTVPSTEALKEAHIQFYMHDTISGPNPSAIRVAPSKPLNFSSFSDPITTNFGSVYVIDNPLTSTPDPKSMLVGRAQGMYAVSSMRDELSLFMSLAFVLVSGPYNGSTFSVVGQNPIRRADRELPVVGGTGAFRLARGYCLLHTHSTSGMNAVIGYNTTLILY